MYKNIKIPANVPAKNEDKKIFCWTIPEDGIYYINIIILTYYSIFAHFKKIASCNSMTRYPQIGEEPSFFGVLENLLILDRDAPALRPSYPLPASYVRG